MGGNIPRGTYTRIVVDICSISLYKSLIHPSTSKNNQRHQKQLILKFSIFGFGKANLHDFFGKKQNKQRTIKISSSNSNKNKLFWYKSQINPTNLSDFQPSSQPKFGKLLWEF